MIKMNSLFRKERTKYKIKPFIYVDNTGNVVSSDKSDTIKHLDKFVVTSHTDTKAYEKAINIVNKKYPQYKGYIWIS